MHKSAMVRLNMTLMALMLLSGCSNEPEADTQAWAAALEDVPGVSSAEVGFRKIGAGERADVILRTETNDSAELEEILRDSVQRFVEVTAHMDTFAIGYSADSADGTRSLRPGDIGWNAGTIEFLREDVAAEIDSSPSSAP